MRTASLVIILLVMMFASTSMGVATAQQARTAWVAYLSSAEEVPTNSSRGTGMASFQLNAAGNAINYWLSVDNIQNVIMAHIHTGAFGQNAAFAVWLYPAAPPPVLMPGVVSAMIGSGTITPANFVGPLAGQPLSALINAINSGGAYVNVHTSALPGGEIRGQIR
jgi:hypothetical protein